MPWDFSIDLSIVDARRSRADESIAVSSKNPRTDPVTIRSTKIKSILT